MKDLINRKAAVDLLLTLKRELQMIDNTYIRGDVLIAGVQLAIDKIELLPSAKTEPFTDIEQRIFLAAIGREEKVCKIVDDSSEPDDVNLVFVCREIERKVKRALWT